MKKNSFNYRYCPDFVDYVREQYHVRLFAYLLKRCQGNQHLAEDLMQDFYTKVISNCHNFQLMYAERKVAYFFVTIKNLHTDNHRKENNRQEFLENYQIYLSTTWTTEDQNAKVNCEEYLNYCKKNLSPLDFRILQLYIEKYTYQQIAELVDMTQSAVGVRINRIKKKLKIIL